MQDCVIFYSYIQILLQLNFTQVPIQSLKQAIQLDSTLKITFLPSPITGGIIYDQTYCQQAYIITKQFYNFQAPNTDKAVAQITGTLQHYINTLLLEDANDFNIKDRLKGSLYGKFAGDALGSIYEFKLQNVTKEAVTKTLIEGGGFITDDSEMTISLAFALIESLSCESLSSNIAKWYQIWIRSNPDDMGLTTRLALDACWGTYDSYDKLYKKLEKMY